MARINRKRVTHSAENFLDIEVITGKYEWNGLIFQNSKLVIPRGQITLIEDYRIAIPDNSPPFQFIHDLLIQCGIMRRSGVKENTQRQ